MTLKFTKERLRILKLKGDTFNCDKIIINTMNDLFDDAQELDYMMDHLGYLKEYEKKLEDDFENNFSEIIEVGYEIEQVERDIKKLS